MPDSEIKTFLTDHRITAHKDSLLFLWATGANLVRALEIVGAWGFEYRSQIVWVKDKPGTGYYTRQRHEPLLICVRGKPPLPQMVPESVVFAPRGAHSAKPPEVRQIIERMYPDFADSRVELFARGTVPGWQTHGFEAGREKAA